MSGTTGTKRVRPRSPAAVVLLLLAAVPSARGQSDLPGPLAEVGFEQRLGEQVPLDLVFRDERGHDVRLGELVDRKPVVLSLVYYECPMLCTEVLNGMLRALKALSFDVGREFDVVTVSFDPSETPALAARKKDGYVSRYGRAGAARGWHFLTGEQESIRRLTEVVGFRYVSDPDGNRFAHASGIMVLTPDGELSRYFYGIDFSPRDLRLGLVEAAENRIGNPVDRLLLYCYHYDPLTGQYGVVIMNVLRLAGLATVLALGAFIWVSFSRERKGDTKKPASYPRGAQ